ncbi:MAG: Coenzyme F420 hydrogenase/dehydrogenase, beta subunit C-terminal domain [Planctomycetota bacterium]
MPYSKFNDDTIPDLRQSWGPVVEVWEGYAGDPEVRHEGASGGVVTALGLYAIEKAGMYGVLHTKAREDMPYLNHTVFSKTRASLMAGTGSRYAPASPCDGLKILAEAPGPCVFVGKPCDTAAIQKAVPLHPRLVENIGVTIAFFCAGTPATIGTIKMLQVMGIDNPASVQSIRYRGRGWPGLTTVVFASHERPEVRQLNYEESWGVILQKYRQWRCCVCADHTGVFADITVGDAWHRSIEQNQPGRSVVLARSARGKDFLHQAVHAGYIVLESSGPEILPACRPAQITNIGTTWGRLMALRLMGVPSPCYAGAKLFRFWWRNLSLRDKLKSLAATVYRVFHKKLYKRQLFVPSSKPETTITLLD